MIRLLLVIDDDADVREAFVDLLEFAGWKVAHVEDGLAALEWLAANPPPSAILLDLKMPRCDGYEFRRRQLADPRLRQVPTIIFTADAGPDDPRATSLGAAPLLRKSAEFDQLIALLDRVAPPT